MSKKLLRPESAIGRKIIIIKPESMKQKVYLKPTWLIKKEVLWERNLNSLKLYRFQVQLLIHLLDVIFLQVLV